MDRITKLNIANSFIAILSLAIIYFFDWPVEVIGVIGEVWVVTSSIQILIVLRKRSVRR